MPSLQRRDPGSSRKSEDDADAAGVGVGETLDEITVLFGFVGF
jgi:hypothetical protein